MSNGTTTTVPVVKPGYKTTEFANVVVMGLASLIVSVLCSRKVINATDADAAVGVISSALLGGAALIAGAIKVVGYAKARATTKANTPTA